jgi:hypothetical protein
MRQILFHLEFNFRKGIKKKYLYRTRMVKQDSDVQMTSRDGIIEGRSFPPIFSVDETSRVDKEIDALTLTFDGCQMKSRAPVAIS